MLHKYKYDTNINNKHDCDKNMNLTQIQTKISPMWNNFSSFSGQKYKYKCYTNINITQI